MNRKSLAALSCVALFTLLAFTPPVKAVLDAWLTYAACGVLVIDNLAAPNITFQPYWTYDSNAPVTVYFEGTVKYEYTVNLWNGGQNGTPDYLSNYFGSFTWDNTETVSTSSAPNPPSYTWQYMRSSDTLNMSSGFLAHIHTKMTKIDCYWCFTDAGGAVIKTPAMENPVQEWDGWRDYRPTGSGSGGSGN